MSKHDESEGSELPNLTTFALAAERGSFTAAAKDLGLTQAAVSQRIQALEKTLRTSLFHRHGGRAQLTEAGQKLYEFALQILDLHKRARQEVTGHKSPITGELRLAASSVPGEHLLPGVLSDFQKRYPLIELRATISDSTAVLSQVVAGEVCLGLVGRKWNEPNLEYRFLARDRMTLILPPDHPLSTRKTISLKDLAAFPLILREVGSGLRHCFESSLEKVGQPLNELQIVAELGSNEAIKRAVLRGMGIALVSCSAVEKEVRSGELLTVKVEDLHCDREMFVVWDTRRILPPSARLFLLFLELHPLQAPEA